MCGEPDNYLYGGQGAEKYTDVNRAYRLVAKWNSEDKKDGHEYEVREFI